MNSGNGYNGRERRRFARVYYPEGNRPRLEVGGREYPVADISERGIKFIADGPDRFSADLEEVRGRLAFSDRETREIRGAVIRLERREDSPETAVVLLLFEEWGITPERIAREREGRDE